MPYTYDSQHLKLEYSSTFPDNLKLIKTLHVAPLEVTGIASCNPRTHHWSWCIGAKDTLIGGRISYNRENNALEYRKALPLPVFGGLTRPVLAAQWRLGSSWRTPPRLQLGLAVTEEPASAIDDGATLRSDGAVAFRKKAFLTRRWGVEVDGDLRMQLSHDLVPGSGGGAAGGNSVRCELAARELNLVLRI